MNAFLKAAEFGIRQGLREAPRMYFAPLILLARLAYQMTESVRRPIPRKSGKAG